jgi:hypothetical protein
MSRVLNLKPPHELPPFKYRPRTLFLPGTLRRMQRASAAVRPRHVFLQQSWKKDSSDR